MREYMLREERTSLGTQIVQMSINNYLRDMLIINMTLYHVILFLGEKYIRSNLISVS